MKILLVIFSLFSFAMAQPECVCQSMFDPVCSKTGITFTNQCELICAEEMLAYRGSCIEELN